jgi:hypothetical protein
MESIRDSLAEELVKMTAQVSLYMFFSESDLQQR